MTHTVLNIHSTIGLFMGLIALLSAACETVDETRLPAELTPVKTTLDVERQWSRTAGAGVDERYLKLRPVLVRDTLYVVDAQGRLNALRVDNGKVLWDAVVDAVVLAGLQRGEGSLFLGTEDGGVIALSQADGRELWRQQLGAEVLALSDAYLGVVVARTADSRLHGLDVRSGEVLWQAGRTTPVLNLRGASRPVVGSGRVVVGFDDGKLVALSPVRGNVSWTTTVANPSGRSELERMVDIDGELKVVDGIIFVASFRGRVAAVTLSDGRILWSRQMSSHMGLDVDAQGVYVTDADGHITALDRVNGATLWKQDKLQYREITAPVIIDEYVMVGDFEGYTHWLSKYDGHFVARSRFDTSGILSTPLVEDDTAYVLNCGGEVAALSIASAEIEDQPPAATRTKERTLRSLNDELPSLEDQPTSLEEEQPPL
jgi:outer membrane protein assembly factor BamB